MKGDSATILSMGGNLKMRRLEKIFCLILTFLMLSIPISSTVSGHLTSPSFHRTDNSTIVKIPETIEEKNQSPQTYEQPEDKEQATFTSYGLSKNETTSMLLEDWNSRGFLPGTFVYTRCNDIEKRTKILKGLLKPIDVDNDGDNDINVIIRMHPTIVFSPLPALAFMTKLTVKRLNDDIKKSDFEIAGELSLPRLFGGSIRLGYHSPAGETVPQTCTVTYTAVPHILSFKKPEHILDVNPAMGIDDTSELIVLATFENATNGATSSIGIMYDPAVHAKIKWGKTRKIGRWGFSISRALPSIKETTATLFFAAEDTLIGVIIDKLTSASFDIELKPLSKEGGSLHYEKKNLRAADISLIIQTANFSGSLIVHNIPKKFDVSWLLRPNGFIELNTHGNDIGKVEATVTNVTILSFDPQTDLDVRITWSNISIKNKSFDLKIDASVYVEIVNMNFYLIYFDENVSDEPIIEQAIGNGTFLLKGFFGLSTSLKLKTLQGNSSLPSVDIPNSTIMLTMKDVNLKFHADNVSSLGEVNLALHAIDTVTISLLAFSSEAYPPPYNYSSWYNVTTLIDASQGILYLEDFDVENFAAGFLDFGHLFMKNLSGVGVMKVDMSIVFPWPTLINMKINNSIGTNLSLEEFSFQFYGIPITIYDTVFVEGISEIQVNMTLSQILMLNIIDADNAKSFGLRFGYREGWDIMGVIGAPILPYAAIYFDHPNLPFNLKLLWYSVGPWNDEEWMEWANENLTDEEWYNLYYGPTGFNWALNGYILLDTDNVSQPANIIVCAPNETIGLLIDSGLSMQADNFRFIWNVTKFMGTFNVLDLIGALTLDGYFSMQNIGEIWICANGEWKLLDQTGPGFFMQVTPGHLQLGGNKTISINETINMMGQDVTIAGIFSLNTANGTFDVWFNHTSVRIGGTVNYTIRDFYFSIGENFTVTADLFHFNLGTSADGSIEITPTVSGSGRIELRNAYIKLENCSITFIGPFPTPNLPPEVTIDNPVENATVSGVVTVSGTAYDPDDNVTLVQIRIDDGEWQNVTGTQSWSYNWDTTTVANGRYTIVARAFDGFDYSEEVLINVTVNNIGVNWRPTVTIEYPKNEDRVEGVVRINGTAMDPDGTVQLVQIRIDYGEWMNATGTTSWSFEWNTSGLMGRHTIEARSYDGMDYSKSLTIKVTVKTEIGGVIEFSLTNASIDINNFSLLIVFTGVMILSEEVVTVEATIAKLHLGGRGSIYAEFGPSGGLIRTGGDGGTELEIDKGLSVESQILRFDANLTLQGGTVGPLEVSWNETSFSFSGNLGVGSVLDINISDLFFEFNNNTVIADWMTLKGSATFDFALGVHQATCNITSAYFSARNFFLRIANYSSQIYANLEFTGSLQLKLGVSDYVTFSEGFIIIGGASHIQTNNTFNINGTEGVLRGDFFLQTTGDVVKIRWNETFFSIDGSGAFTIIGLEFTYGDMIQVSASTLEGVFSVSNGGREGHVELSGDTSISADVDFDHVDENLTLQGSFDVVGDAEGDVMLAWNETGFSLDVDLNGALYLEVTDFVLVYGNITATADEVKVNGSGVFSVVFDEKLNVTRLNVDAEVLLDDVHFEKTGVGVFDVDGEVMIDVKESQGLIEFSGDTSLDIDTIMNRENENVSLRGTFTFVGDASGYIKIFWNETTFTIEGNLSRGGNLLLQITELYFKYRNATLTVDSLSLSRSGAFAILDENGNITVSSTVNLTFTNISIGLAAASVSIEGEVELDADTSLTVGRSASRNFVVLNSSVLAEVNATFVYNNESMSIKGSLRVEGGASRDVQLWWNNTGFGIAGNVVIDGGMHVVAGEEIEIEIEEFLLNRSASFEFWRSGNTGFCKITADHLELNTYLYFRHYNISGSFNVNMTIEGVFIFWWW